MNLEAELIAALQQNTDLREELMRLQGHCEKLNDECNNLAQKCTELEAQLREQHQNQLDLMEKIPIEPEEIYSPNIVIIG